MLLRCKLFRPGGTRIHLGKGKEARHYHFKPLDDKASAEDPRVDHVADVDSQEDVATLLGIKEAYEIDASEIKSRVAPKKAVAEESSASSSSAAAAASGTVAPAAAAAPGSATPIYTETTPRKDLLAAAQKKLGKKPNPATSTKKLLDILNG